LDLPDIFRAILEHLQYAVEVSFSSTDKTEGEGGFDIKVIKAGVKGTVEQTQNSQLIVTSPTDVGMNKIIRDHRLVIVLDEMHKASAQLRTAVVDWIKATRAIPGEFSIVLVGTSTDAGRLVSLDYGIDRYVKEMYIGIMTKEESRFIIEEGFRRLNISIDERLKGVLVSSAAGAPTIVQSLCLEVAEAALEDGRNRVTEEDIKFAINQYLKENTGRLNDHYYKAIETTGKRRYRKQVLRAAALTPNDYVTMEDIRYHVSENLGEDVPATSLSGPLRELKKPEFGSILKDVDRDVSGNRIRNLTAFTEPIMKSFVRFMNNLDETGFMPPAPQEISDDGNDF